MHVGCLNIGPDAQSVLSYYFYVELINIKLSWKGQWIHWFQWGSYHSQSTFMILCLHQ